MDLTMFNVKFGECIQLETDNNEALMIDCGTKNSRKIVNDIAINFCNKKIAKKNAMISHFDYDHISGFEYLANSKKHKKAFDKFYIPYITVYKDHRGISRNILIEVAIYLYLFTSDKGLTYHQSKALLQHIEIVTALTKKYKNIFALSKGDKFILESKNFDVIWPDIRCNYYSDLDFMIKIVDEIESKFRDLEEFNEIKDLKNRITDNMTKWFNIVKDNVKGEDSIANHIDDIDGVVNEIAENQKRFMEELNKYKNHIIRENSYFMIMDSLPTSPIRILKYVVSKDFYKDMNDTSIVFQNEQLKCLFTGDATNMVMRQIDKNKDFLTKYKFIKLQHHATERYYSDLLPHADRLIISNGGYTSFKIGYKFRKYLNGGKSKIYCTNGISGRMNYCEINDNNGGICPSNCILEGDIKLHL